MPAMSLSEDQYELELLQRIIEQLRTFAHKRKVKEILDLLDGEIERIDLDNLRTKIKKICETENTAEDYRNPLFYNMMFSFLLILAKYAPLNDLEDNQPVCGISQNVIEPQHRLLTSSGFQFEKTEELKTWINRHHSNPLTTLPFSKREKSYLDEAFKVDQENAHEIPFPKDAPPPIENRGFRIDMGNNESIYMNKKKFIGAIIASPIFLAMGALGLFVGIAGIYYSTIIAWGAGDVLAYCWIASIAVAAGIIMAGVGISKLIILGVETGLSFLEEKLKNCFSHTEPRQDMDHVPTVPISPLIQRFFAYLKNHHVPKVEVKPSSSVKNIHELLSKANPEPAEEKVVVNIPEDSPPPIEASNKAMKNDFFLEKVESEAKLHRAGR